MRESDLKEFQSRMDGLPKEVREYIKEHVRSNKSFDLPTNSPVEAMRLAQLQATNIAYVAITEPGGGPAKAMDVLREIYPASPVKKTAA